MKGVHTRGLRLKDKVRVRMNHEGKEVWKIGVITAIGSSKSDQSLERYYRIGILNTRGEIKGTIRQSADQIELIPDGMHRAFLKNGMIAVTRRMGTYHYYGNTAAGSYFKNEAGDVLFMCYYRADLTHLNNSNFDIMELRETTDAYTLFTEAAVADSLVVSSRIPEVKEMTLADIIKELGYDIKIVDKG